MAADLLIAGTGAYENVLRKQAQGLSHVHFLGRLDYESLRLLYRPTLAVLVPLLCFETFGFIVIEAFSMRTPMIVNDIGALPEVAIGCGGGLVYRTPAESLEHMERLRAQPVFLGILGERGYRNYLEHYTVAEHLKQYYALIEEIESARSDCRSVHVNWT
jgi:glycosyltransferase involved in cell wall biosynthesis